MCEAPEHDADHGKADEGYDGSGIALEIGNRATISADPGESPFDYPALAQDDEALEIGLLNDLGLLSRIAPRHGITTDSFDSSSSWTGSKICSIVWDPIKQPKRNLIALG